MVQVPVAQSECVTKTEFISPCNRETDLFDIGYLIAQLRWHLRVSVFCSSYADEESAKTCIARIQPLLSSLFPDHRGGEAYEVAEGFRRFWDTLHTEWFAEESHAAFNDRADVLEVADVVRRLQPFVERVDEAILAALMAAYRENERLLRALQLGRCVGEGLYPTLNDDEFFEVVDNPEFAHWLSTGCGTGSFTLRVPGTRQPPSKLIRPKRINAGEFEPDTAWSNDLRSLLAANGLIGPLPVSLDLSEQTPKERSETIQALIDRIRARFQVTSYQGFDPQVSQQLLQTVEPEPTRGRLSEAIPFPQSTGDEYHVVVMTSPSPDETVVETGVCSTPVGEKGSLPADIAPTTTSPVAAGESTLAFEAGNSDDSTRTSRAEAHPWKEWKVNDRIVTFRNQQKTFTQANADFLKAIVSGNRWPTVDEVCDTCFRDTPRDKRRHSLRSTISKFNVVIRVQFDLPPDWRAVRRGKKRNSPGEKLLEIVMPDAGIREQA